MLARDGEGATKLVTVTVRGALMTATPRPRHASVADSPLVKTALFGNDANWGRVAMAVGKSAARVDQERLGIVFAGIEVCRDGAAVPFDEDEAYSALDTDEVAIEIDLALGERRGDGADLRPVPTSTCASTASTEAERRANARQPAARSLAHTTDEAIRPRRNDEGPARQGNDAHGGAPVDQGRVGQARS